MKHALANLLRAALIPELRTNVAAGSAGNIHLVLVAISAVRAFPNELSAIFDNLNFAVIAADLTVIALCVQFGIHDIVIYKPHDLENLAKASMGSRTLTW